MANSGLYRGLAFGRCAALHALGKHRQELREALRLRAWKPDEDAFIFRELQARVALGHLDRVEELVEEAERKQGWGPDAAFWASRGFRAHGDREAALAMAEKELIYVEAWPAEEHETQRYRLARYTALQNLERWDDARVMAEAMVQEQPSSPQYLYYLGRIAASGGDRETAVRISGELAAMDIPYDQGTSTAMRGDIAAILGAREQAVALLREAYDQGTGFRFWMMHSDPAYEPLRDYPPFEEFMRPKG
jgi:tetratricopeptide (TPR) repeat protein